MRAQAIGRLARARVIRAGAAFSPAIIAPAALLLLRTVTADRATSFADALLVELAASWSTYLYVGTLAAAAAVALFVFWSRLDRAQALSMTDSVTSLFNRRYFDARLRAEVARAHRHASSLALLFIDIDRLKSINDIYGHAAGDAALAAVGDALRSVLRSSDVAARIGGDELAVILPETDAADALAFAERLHGSVRALKPPNLAALTISIGAADLALESRESPDELRLAADAALYRAKAAGRDQTYAAPALWATGDFLRAGLVRPGASITVQ